MPRVVRIVRWFDRTVKKLAGPAPLKHATLRQLRRMSGVAANDPMYDRVRLAGAHAPKPRAFPDVRSQHDGFDYFPDADAI